jgi:hypothetical protein
MNYDTEKLEKLEKKVKKMLLDSDSKLYNFLDSDYKNYKLDEAIRILRNIYNEYKELKMPSKQNQILLEINSIYDKLYLHNSDRIYKKYQSTNLKDLLTLNEKYMTLKDDKLYYIELYIKISRETTDENTYIRALEYIIKCYKNDDTMVDIVINCYNELYILTDEYKEHYGDILAINKQEYKEAAEIYEHIGEHSLTNLRKFSCPTYFLKSILCYILHNDDIYTEIKLQKFSNEYIIIQNSHIYKFMIDIANSYFENNLNKFTNIIIEYDNISKLDNYYIVILNNIKNKIKDNINNTNDQTELL